MLRSLKEYKNQCAAPVYPNEEAKKKAEAKKKKNEEKRKVMGKRLVRAFRLWHRMLSLGQYVLVRRLYLEGDHADSKVCVCVCE